MNTNRAYKQLIQIARDYYPSAYLGMLLGAMLSAIVGYIWVGFIPTIEEVIWLGIAVTVLTVILLLIDGDDEYEE